MSNLKDLLSVFNPISLQEMDRVKLMNRVDTKFGFSVVELILILPELAKYYDILEIEGTRIPSYKSLYFDTDKFNFFSDHHNKRSNRFKVRFRNYVESNLSFLEVKHKFKGRTDKKRIRVEEIPNDLNPEHLGFLKKIMGKELLLQPKMWNSFSRLTLVHKELNERLTLDMDLTFSWGEEHCMFDQLVIAELKQETVSRKSTFFELMKKRGIRPYRLSKYCIGAIELYGPTRLKFNRFKKKLLTLKKINTHAA